MSPVLLVGKDSETTRSIMQALTDKNCPTECAHGGADALVVSGASRSMYSSPTRKRPLRKTWRWSRKRARSPGR